MAHDALPDEWDLLASWLPDNLGHLAREHRFIRRARGRQDPSLWLRLFLMHAGGRTRPASGQGMSRATNGICGDG